MSEEIRNLGNICLWIAGHVLFTLIAVTSVRGAYQFYEDYRNHIQIFDVAGLSVDEKNQLAQALFDDPMPGTSAVKKR